MRRVARSCGGIRRPIARQGGGDGDADAVEMSAHALGTTAAHGVQLQEAVDDVIHVVL
jgi:hypothetical protein